MYCSKHPKVETALTCGRCGIPICPNCTIQGPVGGRCKDCASQRSSSLYQIRPERLVLATVLGLTAGTIVGLLLQALSGIIYFMLFLGPMIGGAVATVILKASGYKRGLVLEVVAGGSVVIGAAVSLLVSGGWMMMIASPVSLVLYLVSVGLTASAAVGRIRYM